MTIGDVGKGLDGSDDAFVVTDIYSGLRVAYPLPDKLADSNIMALRLFAATRSTEKLYSDRSGEISRVLKDLGVMAQGSQLGLPQTNALAERANGEIITGTRALLLGAGLPYYLWE